MVVEMRSPVMRILTLISMTLGMRIFSQHHSPSIRKEDSKDTDSHISQSSNLPLTHDNNQIWQGALLFFISVDYYSLTKQQCTDIISSPLHDVVTFIITPGCISYINSYIPILIYADALSCLSRLMRTHS